MKHFGNRYSDDKLEEFKQLINQQLEDTHQEARLLKGRLDELEGQSGEAADMDYGDVGKNQEDREWLTLQYERQVEKIHELELALGRIANQTFGIDENTGELIHEDRLRVMPTATTGT